MEQNYPEINWINTNWTSSQKQTILELVNKCGDAHFDFHKLSRFVIKKKICDEKLLKQVSLCWTGLQVFRIMNLKGKENNFQPSKLQIAELIKIFGSNFWNTKSPKEWVDNLTVFTMFPQYWKNRDTILNDQKERARAIVNEFIINPHKKYLFALDGNGNFQFCFWKFWFRAVKSGKISKDRYIHVHIIDFDPEVTAWHKFFLNSSTTCVNGNLFDLMEQLSTDENIKSSIYYWNFCGTGSSSSDMINKFLRKNTDGISWLSKLTSQEQYALRKNPNSFNDKQLLQKFNIERDTITSSLNSCAAEFGVAHTDSICETLHFLFRKVPFIYFSCPVVLTDWLAKLIKYNDAITYVSFSVAR